MVTDLQHAIDTAGQATMNEEIGACVEKLKGKVLPEAFDVQASAGRVTSTVALNCKGMEGTSLSSSAPTIEPA